MAPASSFPSSEDVRWDRFHEPGGRALIPADRPLLGWRWWAVSVPGDYGRDGARLVSPFVHDGNQHRWTEERDELHVWQPGTNTSRSDWCQEAGTRDAHVEHTAPQPWCTCGIRSMRYLEGLLAYYRSRRKRREVTLDAVARLASWGQVCGPCEDRDHADTVRAEFAEITGPVYLRDLRWANDIAAEYGTEVLPWDGPE
ncbi:hypothetical protein [Actinomadura macrotermitis]|uniref:Uncharacterized protein n=1 Tax=Actinomadura macrotermitis TaxID=2585200 RepID=A0A7K0BT27_9ACTN|nr:hypothetical protein [Actinomadura macrotermitis]MQY04343.1 hypothetical protein [Actinomadura macrotermitis]